MRFAGGYDDLAAVGELIWISFLHWLAKLECLIELRLGALGEKNSLDHLEFATTNFPNLYRIPTLKRPTKNLNRKGFP